jgi:calcineurin-like phosphoesterase family protein
MRLIYLYLQAIIARIKRSYRKNNLSWFISDTHFGHQNVINYCLRPFKTKEQMDKFLIFQWNCFIAPEDTVYHLGDFSLNKEALSILGPKLNGRKFLVSGNHDKTYMFKNRSNKKLQTELNKATTAGWTVNQKIELGAVKNGKDLTIIMTHLPPKQEGTEAYDARYMNERIEHNPNALHLHGHLHGKYVKKGNLLDVGWDVMQRPLTFQEIVGLYEDSREFIPSRLGTFYANRKDQESAG